MILLCDFFVSVFCMLPLTVNTKPVSQSVVSLENGKVTAWTAINLCVWNPITASSFGARVNTQSCEDELLPIFCVHGVFCVREKAFNLWAKLTVCSYSTNIYFQATAVWQVKDKTSQMLWKQREELSLLAPGIPLMMLLAVMVVSVVY